MHGGRFTQAQLYFLPTQSTFSNLILISGCKWLGHDHIGDRPDCHEESALVSSLNRSIGESLQLLPGSLQTEQRSAEKPHDRVPAGKSFVRHPRSHLHCSSSILANTKKYSSRPMLSIYMTRCDRLLCGVTLLQITRCDFTLVR